MPLHHGMPFHFGPGNGRVATKTAEKLDAIARANGCAFVTANRPGDGPRYWFEGPNRGDLLNDRLATRIIDAAIQAGVWPPESAGS